MENENYLITGLAVFDLSILLILALAVWRLQRPKGEFLIPVAMGISGFVLHAVLFFSGTILYVQLATIATAFVICLFWSSRNGQGFRNGSK